MLGRFLVLQIFEQQLQGFASIIANRQFYRFEHLKTGFVVQYGSPICKHWVADLQTLGRRFASRKICPTSARNLPATVANRRFANTGSPICKRWVSDLQAETSAQHLPEICPQQLPTNLPRSVSIEPVNINQPQTDI